MFLYDFLSSFNKPGLKSSILITSLKNKCVQFLMFISLIFPYICLISFCFSTNEMFVIKNMTNKTMYAFYNLSTDSYTHSFKRTCGKYLLPF